MICEKELETRVAEPIWNAFAEIEKHDIRVTDMQLERTKYRQMLQTLPHQDIISRVIETRDRGIDNLIGYMYGAKLRIVDDGQGSKVFGTKHMKPSYHLNPYEAKFKNNCLEADIAFLNNAEFKILQIKNNLTIIVKSRAEFFNCIPKNEWTAIETLREMITEAEFRKYLKYGFILVKGQSGKIYQIFRSKRHTKVWQDGQLVEEVCVRIKDKNIPPTDNIIAFKALIETSEDEFKKLGNVYRNFAA